MRNFLLFCGLFLQCFLSAMEVNFGTTIAHDYRVKTAVFHHNGTIKATNVFIEAGLVRGDATIEADRIVIICDDFEFTGTIVCQKECIIYVKNDFDHSLFTIDGPGTCTLFIGTSSVHVYDESRLLEKSRAMFVEHACDITDDTVLNKVKEVRHDAHMNMIDEARLVQHLNEQLDARIAYCADHLSCAHDTSELLRGTLKTGVGLVGVSAAVAFGARGREVSFDHDQSAYFVSAALLGFLSAVLMMDATDNVDRWAHPHFKERYEQLKQTKMAINRAFSKWYIDPIKKFEL